MTAGDCGPLRDGYEHGRARTERAHAPRWGDRAHVGPVRGDLRPALRSLVCVAVPVLTELRDQRDEILRVAEARGARRVRVFGSVARGDSSETSDIDFLVDLDEQRSLFDLGGLLMDLRELLGCDVDVTTEAGLRPRVAERVLADAVDL